MLRPLIWTVSKRQFRWGITTYIFIAELIKIHHHGVSRAEFSLTEPIPVQAVYIDHSRNPRLLYGSPWSRTHGRWLKEFFRTGRWLLLGRLPPWLLTSSRKTSAQWCCVNTTPNWPIRLWDSWRWECLISSQQVIDLSTAYNINNHTQGAKVIANSSVVPRRPPKVMG